MSKKTEKRSVKTVEEYVNTLPSHQKRIVSLLLALVREAAPEATLSIKWAQPVFEQNGPFCYVRAFKNYVNLGFWRGASISTGKGILESSGEKMSYVKIATESEIRAKLFQSWVKEALKLIQAKGDPTKGR